MNRNISTLRKALGEKPSDHRFIETVPKTGYRFSAPVRAVAYRAPAPAAANDTLSAGCGSYHSLKLDRLDDDARTTASLPPASQGRGFDSAGWPTSMRMSPQDVEETLRELSEIHGLIDRRQGKSNCRMAKFAVRYRFVYAILPGSLLCLAGSHPDGFAECVPGR